jgi:lipoprotein signal peptidase
MVQLSNGTTGPVAGSIKMGVELVEKSDIGGKSMRILLVAGLVLALDQVSKLIIASQMSPGESIPVIQGVFHLTFVRNPGAAFSLLPYRTAFLVLVAVLVMGAILYALSREQIQGSLARLPWYCNWEGRPATW